MCVCVCACVAVSELSQVIMSRAVEEDIFEGLNICRCDISKEFSGGYGLCSV